MKLINIIYDLCYNYSHKFRGVYDMTDMVRELLENNTLTPEVAEALDAKVMAMVTPLRNDLKTLREEKNTLAESFESANSAKEALEAKTADIDTKIAEAKEAGKAELVTVLQSERAKNEELAEKLSSMAKVNTDLNISNGISSELGKYQVKKESFGDVSELLRMKATSGENGLMIGDLSIEDGVKDFFENRKSYLEATGGQGSGSGGQGGSGGNSKGSFGGDPKEMVNAVRDMIGK